MRKENFTSEKYYHIYNRGVDRRDIFMNKKDIERFIESIYKFNQTEAIGSISNSRKTQIGPKALSGEPLVSILAYCLNPNHFHFFIKQSVDGGISKFMQKLQGGYTTYFNLKNSRSGVLFQGTFKAHIIDTDGYFNKIIGYVNKNYKIHNIPKNKKDLILASDFEYENDSFKIVSKTEGKEILKIFGGNKSFKKHCEEIISILLEERGKTSLLEEDNFPNNPR